MLLFNFQILERASIQDVPLFEVVLLLESLRYINSKKKAEALFKQEQPKTAEKPKII